MRRVSSRRLHFVPLFFALPCALACGADPGDPGMASLYGAWRWIGSTGGITGTRMDPASEGFNTIFYFHRDGSLDVYRDDRRQHHSPVSVARVRSADGSQSLVLRYARPLTIFPFDLGIRRQSLRRPAADTLVLADPCCDRYEHTLVRIVWWSGTARSSVSRSTD